MSTANREGRTAELANHKNHSIAIVICRTVARNKAELRSTTGTRYCKKEKGGKTQDLHVGTLQMSRFSAAESPFTFLLQRLRVHTSPWSAHRKTQTRGHQEPPGT